MREGKAIKGQSMLNGALILVAATLIVKVIGAVYKIPLTNIIGVTGRGYFSSAYEIYTPIYAISMAGLPVAVSKMVSESVTLGRYRDAQMIFRVAKRLFLIVGIVGTVLLTLIAFPYVIFGNCFENLWSILMIAPSIFFCCMMSTYRGYYEGLRNMTPTAISQVIEALGKLLLGLVFAKGVMLLGLSRFEAGKSVFGKVCADKDAALEAIYPFAAAAAVFAVTLGTVAAFLFMVLYKKIRGNSFTKTDFVNSPRAKSSSEISSTLITIAIPMVISALITNVTNLIDTFTIRTRLASTITDNLDYFNGIFDFAQRFNFSSANEEITSQVGTYLMGCYFSALDFKNLITSLTMSLGVSAIPALAAAMTIKNKKEVSSTLNSLIRVCMLVATPAGFGIAALAEPILALLYGGNPETSGLVPISSPIVLIYGLGTFVMALSTPLTNSLQAMGRVDIPAKIIAIGAIIKVICNYIFVGIPQFNIYGATIGTLVCYVFIVAMNLFFTIKVSKTKINFISTIIKPIFAATVSALSAYATHAVFSKILTFGEPGSTLNGTNFSTLLAIGVAVVIYAITLLVIKGISKDDLLMLPKGRKIAKALEKFDLIG